jgi:cytidine deaminase
MTDWEELHGAAVQAARTAYAPYSGLHVGAAGVSANGQLVTGSNVENASFGLTLCAECSLVSDLRRVGADKLVAVSIVDGEGRPLLPCGRCRQLLLEHGGPALMINADPEPVSLEELLPHAFDAQTLEDRVDPTTDGAP